MKTSISKTLCACLLLGVTNINGRAEEIYPWQLTSDSLLLFEGTTYRYTVDTPENEGLVSTLPTVMELKKNWLMQVSVLLIYWLLMGRKRHWECLKTVIVYFPIQESVYR